MVGRWRNTDSDQESIEVILLNPDGTPLDRPQPTGDGSADAADLSGIIADGIRRLGRTTATPGHRAGGTSGRVTRQGCDEEVVTPVLVSPELAAAAMAGRDFWSQSATGLSVDPTSLQIDRAGLHWRARLRTGPLCRRAANLRVYSSPSRNVTVLELVPEARRLIQTRAFVRRGVPAIGELAARLDRLQPGRAELR